jgi:hypothetical protein
MRSASASISAPTLASILASVLVLGALVASCASANAAAAHRQRPRPHVTASPGQVTAPGAPAGTARFAVPGWSNGSTERWLDNASALVGVGG